MINTAGVDPFGAILVGLTLAGVVATGFEAAMRRPASFELLESGDARALASLPLVILSAPFIILRAATRKRRFETTRMAYVTIATVIALIWAMACGQVTVDLIMLIFRGPAV